MIDSVTNVLQETADKLSDYPIPVIIGGAVIFAVPFFIRIIRNKKKDR